MNNYNDLFLLCKKGNAKAQRMLYDLFKGRLMGLCRRYTRSREEAQDVLQESFIKIFSKIDQLESVDKLEGWLKSVTIRTAIDQYNKTKSHDSFFQKINDYEMEKQIDSIALADATDEFILELINTLPEGCKVVFNLFIVEGYNHAEIAEMLQVSEGTSRSQLHRAKQLLQVKLKSHNLANYYEKLA